MDIRMCTVSALAALNWGLFGKGAESTENICKIIATYLPRNPMILFYFAL